MRLKLVHGIQNQRGFEDTIINVQIHNEIKPQLSI